MGDLKSARAIYLKAFLFLLIGILACGMLILENPTLKTAGLLALAVWGFARAYYFAFYVIEHYVDSSFKFSGLWAFGKYLVRRRARPSATKVE